MNGVGERAGNTALEEVVMAVKSHRDIPVYTDIETGYFHKASHLVSTLMRMPVQPNKAIVGENAFAHEAGIHQDGVLKNKETYEIMTPESIGITEKSLVLGKHSGKAALKARIQELGYDVTTEELEEAFVKFKDLADKMKMQPEQ